jgi:hypothetical protein
MCLHLQVDYTVLHQVLLESDITLHILMNDEFIFEKNRMNKIFYGRLSYSLSQHIWPMTERICLWKVMWFIFVMVAILLCYITGIDKYMDFPSNTAVHLL